MLIKMIMKDLKLMFHDKEYVLIVVFMPIILSSILSFALQSSFESTIEIEQFKIGVVKEYEVNEDYKIPFITENTVSDDIIKDINGDKIFFNNFLDQKEINDIMAYEILDYNEGIEKIKNDEISALIILDRNFSNNVLLNFVSPFRKEINIRIVKNEARSITSNIANEIIKGFNKRMNQMVISKNVLIELAANRDITSSLEDIDSKLSSFNESIDEFKVNITNSSIENRPFINSSSYYSAAMFAMFLLFVAGSSSTLLLDEKKRMTYDRMIVSGISKETILLGKYCTILMLAIIESIVMITYSSIILKVYWGSMVNILLIVISAAITVASFGLMISIIAFNSNNRKLTVLLNSVVFQVLAALGGSFIPVQVLPSIIQKLRYLPFNGVVLKLILNSMQGLSINESIFEFSLLGVNVIIFLSMSYLLMRKEAINVKSN